MSSSRLMNSGRKWLLMTGSRIAMISSLSGRPRECSIFSRSISEPKLEVMMKRAFLQLTILPLLSVRRPIIKDLQ